jgi:hypothetical protein
MIRYSLGRGHVSHMGGEDLVEATRCPKREEEAAEEDTQGEATGQAGEER